MLPAEIQTFFEQYREAFDRLDGAAVAGLYATPCGIASDTGYVHWTSPEPVISNMLALCGQYRQKGFVSTTFEPSTFLAQGERFAVADLVWTIHWDKGQESWRFNTTYNLIRTEGGWRVLLCTAYSEEKLAK